MHSLDTDRYVHGKGHVTDSFRQQNRLLNIHFSRYYCWVGVRMFSIGVVIIMLSSVVAWTYVVIKGAITNHNMWPIISTNVSLGGVQSHFRLFLLHGHLRVMTAMNIWTWHIDGYIQERTVICAKALPVDSLHTRYLFIFFLKWHLKLITKNIPLQWEIGSLLGV